MTTASFTAKAHQNLLESADAHLGVALDEARKVLQQTIAHATDEEEIARMEDLAVALRRIREARIAIRNQAAIKAYDASREGK